MKTQNTDIKTLVKTPAIVDRFKELAGENARYYLNTIIQMVNNNKDLAKADPMSILSAASVAAALKLSINPTLGHAYIIPYMVRSKDGQRYMAQFQIGYKGYIQLAHRTNMYKRIGATKVYEGELAKYDPVTGHKFKWGKRDSDRVIGYLAFFKLKNGFEADLYMTTAQVQAHAKRYSHSYREGLGMWADEDGFDTMAIKTVLKLLLSKFAPLSEEMEKAIAADQALVTEEGEFCYIDNDNTTEQKTVLQMEQRIISLIEAAENKEQLDNILAQIPQEYMKSEIVSKKINDRYEQLS